jgi:hypothetical protein
VFDKSFVEISFAQKLVFFNFCAIINLQSTLAIASGPGGTFSVSKYSSYSTRLIE